MELAPTNADAVERIALTVSRTGDVDTIARLLIGGLAARLGLSFEVTDDLQLAVEAVLGELDEADERAVVIDLAVDRITIRIGPCQNSLIQALSGEPASAFGLAQVLPRLTDGIEVDERGWVELSKQRPAAAHEHAQDEAGV